jgi:hypothetical protein
VFRGREAVRRGIVASKHKKPINKRKNADSDIGADKKTETVRDLKTILEKLEYFRYEEMVECFSFIAERIKDTRI